VFQGRGFQVRAIYRIANLGDDLRRWRRAGAIGRWYDRLIMRWGITALMGDGCVVCQAPGGDVEAPGVVRAPREQRFAWAEQPPWPVG
jgi:hypothetical protein